VKTITIAILLMTLGSLNLAARDAASAEAEQKAALAAQNEAAALAPRSSLATTDCTFPFSTGTGNTLLKYCVTTNGNIVQLETPQGVEHVAVGTIGEGYGICDFNTNTGYFDYAGFGDSGNWNPAQVVKQTATSVKIVRTTSDGQFTLTQNIAEVDGALPWIKITMTLKNNGEGRDAFLIRYVDVDAAGVAKNNLDTTENSAFAWNTPGPVNFGVVVQNVGKALIANSLTQFQAAGPDPCNPVFNLHLLTNTDGSLGMEYLVELKKGASTTVITAYRGM